MRKLALFLAVLFFPLIFTVCDSPMGFGDVIDFEPPVLTIDPGPNPRYINRDTVLTGTATDNVGVTKIICRDALNPSQVLGTAKLNGTRWSLTFNFTEKDNGKKIAAEVVAYDKAGNSGESSIKPVNLYVDIHSPIFEEMLVWRSSTRTTVLESLQSLRDLARDDPQGLKPLSTDRYQNGAFWLGARVREDETRINENTLVLRFYDSEHDNEDDWVYNKNRDSGSVFAPRWTVTETEIARKGDERGWRYSGRLAAGEKLFFRVRATAEDLAGNKKVEDFGYFCLYRDADKPKARISLSLGENILPGTEIPMEVWDDDLLEEAWVDIMAKTQFNNYAGATEQAKLETIKNNLLNNVDVWNWRNQGTAQHNDTGADAMVTRRIAQGGPYPELLNIMLTVGKNDADYGDYKIIVIAKDKKTPPHDDLIADTRPDSLWGYYAFDINVTDNNYPLIVIDTVDTTKPAGTGPDNYNAGSHLGNDTITAAKTGNSPEENTFPKLVNQNVAGVDRAFFTMNGYTLRLKNDLIPVANQGVETFKIAWIPYGVTGGQESYVEQVKKAMKENNEASLDTLGIQHWTLSDYTNTSIDSYFINGSEQTIAGVKYLKQTFKKKFDILGGSDDLKPTYNNFHYKNLRENKPKLFVLYARDRDNHEVFKTIRLLGNEAPPSLRIYDFTSRNEILTLPGGFDPTIAGSDITAAGPQGTYYSTISGQTRTDADLLPAFKTYPRGTTLKLHARAASTGEIGIDEIRMYDITKNAASTANERGYRSTANQDITYAELIPDVSQRVFLFTAKNKLGIPIEIQRTVATTTTATLDRIITPLASGTYGGGEPIILRAQFSGLVKVPNGARPVMRIRYQSGSAKTWVYEEVPFSGAFESPTMYLEFRWTVPVSANGLLETIDSTAGVTPPGTWTAPDDKPDGKNWPIYLNGGRILDAERLEPAFLPGYNSNNWINGVCSLQDPTDGKVISLDGMRPVVQTFTAGGKLPYDPLEPKVFYFKSGETIAFTLTASKDIRTSGNGNPRIEFRVNGYNNNAAIFADYLRPAGTNGMLFAVDVTSLTPTAANTSQTGTIELTGLNTAQGGIADMVGNPLDAANLTTLFNNLPNGPYHVNIDKRAPAQVTPRVGSSTPQPSPNPPPYIANKYNENPILTIPVTETTATEPWGVFTQYSMDEGLSWANYPDAKSPWTAKDGADLRINNGEWRLRTRQVDKAGNESAMSQIYSLDVNGTFPKLVSVSAVQPNGIYKGGVTITINLDFENSVKTTLGASDTNRAYIIVSDRTANSTAVGPGITNTAIVYARRQTADNITTLSFDWAVENKQMPSGLTVTQIRLSGDVVDSYNNMGVDSRQPTTLSTVTMYANNANPATSRPTYTVNNLNGAGLIVDSIPPSLVSANPPLPSGNGAVLEGDLKTIILTFDENVRKEMGVISIRPRGTYPIPPVFPAESYTQADGTYVQSFYEVYSSPLLDSTHRGYLLQGTYDKPTLHPATGLYMGPYKLTTQGLKPGPGYKADKAAGTTPVPLSTDSGWNADTGWNATWDASNTNLNDTAHFMIPDTTAKFVLDYQYGINDDVAAVRNIRAALDRAHYRWRDIDVISSNVTIAGNVVTIKLDTPLEEGFQWTLEYPKGTFTDDPAGNEAPAMAAGTYWFWTDGVQKPVIRVDRKSLDYRQTVNIALDNTLTYNTPSTTAANAGVNFNAFDTINFRVESETPGATVSIGTLRGAQGAAGAGEYSNGGVLMAFTGNITDSSPGYAWDDESTGLSARYGKDGNINTVDTGTWILPNLIHRSASTTASFWVSPLTANASDLKYTVIENGVTVQRQGVGYLRIYRSYNRDAKRSELNSITLTPLAGFQSSFTNIGRLMASKNYVAATATLNRPNHPTIGGSSTSVTSARAYEGVFKTVVAINKPNPTGGSNTKYFSGENGDRPIQLFGSNTEFPPSIAGFPLMLGTIDLRYRKVPYNGLGSDRYYWLSTEIVSPLFIQFTSLQNSSDIMACASNLFGESGNFLSGGYGDLTYTFNQDVKN
jgi:hypothetical protein